jgi:SAM-dependent methyltransferase
VILTALVASVTVETRTQPWFVEFFGADYLLAYEPLLTEERTQDEVAFVERVLGLRSGQAVLDLCCGPGRHTLLLAKHGISATGQDLSERYIENARECAAAQGLSAQFVRGDMREIPFAAHFDAVINLFTSFGYLETDADNTAVLRAVARALKPGGRLLLDTMNLGWVLANQVPEERHERPDGTVLMERRRFDDAEGRNHVWFELTPPGGAMRELVGHHVRLYSHDELVSMAADAGLEPTETYGGFDGSSYEVGSRRLILVARKPA